MRTQDAKRIPLKDILARLGHEPARPEKNGELWYVSPFRVESEPSFKVNMDINGWFDFGEGKGGNILDFVMRYYRLTQVSDALRKLDDLEGLTPSAPTLPLAAPPAPKVDALTVTSLQPLQNRALIGYLRQRGITQETAAPYLQEIHYTRGGKPYFALAFPNQSGGYELRNPYFKGVHGHKDISVLGDTTTGQAAVFEGFMDFLSALVWGENLDGLVVVLNSVVMGAKAIETIQKKGIQALSLYLDHDTKGRELTEAFTAGLPQVAVSDKSGLYAGNKDFNEFLVHQKVKGAAPALPF